MMTITWCPVISILLYLHVFPAGAITPLTNFTFVLELLTWNDARNSCQQMGGHLVEIRDETKDNAVLHVIDKYYHHLETGKYGVAIGLANLTVGGQDFYWEHSCEPMAWANWGPNQNEKRLCVKIEANERVWSRGSCRFPRSFICEQTSDAACPYERQTLTGLSANGLVNKTFDNVTDEECLRLCDTEILNDMECWAANTPNIQEPKCLLYFTKEPYIVTNSSYQIQPADSDLYTKQCFSSNIVTSYNLSWDTNSANVPQFTCDKAKDLSTVSTTPDFLKTSTSRDDEQTISTTELSETTPITDLSTVSTTPDFLKTSTARDDDQTVSTTELSETTPTTDLSTVSTTPDFLKTSAARDDEQTVLTTELSETTPTTDLSTVSSTPDRLKTSAARDDEQTVSTKELSETTPTTDLSTVSTTPDVLKTSATRDDEQTASTTELSETTPTTVTTSVYYRVCRCPCHVPWSVDEKQRVMEDLLRNLTINKTELSSFRRKYYSVLDERPLSVGIGCTGVVLIAVFIGVIVMCDVTTVMANFKHISLFNSN